jgi:hypothetical protein
LGGVGEFISKLWLRRGCKWRTIRGAGGLTGSYFTRLTSILPLNLRGKGKRTRTRSCIPLQIMGKKPVCWRGLYRNSTSAGTLHLS